MAKKKAKKAKRSKPKRVVMKTTVSKKVVVQNPKKKRRRKNGPCVDDCVDVRRLAPLERSIKSLKSQNKALRTKLAAKKNPNRPPRRWWDRCLASVSARKYARDPAAICNAAWWKQPAKKRAATVRRLERGTPKQRRFAVAIAKAEQKHADGPPRRSNPGMSDEAARREYERTHWGERGRDRVGSLRAANPRHGTATALGKLVSVVYLTQKGGDDELTEYEHHFEDGLPTLAYNDGGLIVAGGGYRIKEGGIDG